MGQFNGIHVAVGEKAGVVQGFLYFKTFVIEEGRTTYEVESIPAGQRMNPKPGASLVFANAIFQVLGVHYTISGRAIVLTSSPGVSDIGKELAVYANAG